VVIDDFDLHQACVRPDKADPPLVLILMLCCPARLPCSNSNLLPGGERKSRNSVAALSIESFRVATVRMFPQRLELPDSKRTGFYPHRKLSITL